MESMKRIIIVLIIIATTVPVFAKGKNSKYDLSLGISQQEVKNVLGKPSIVTKDSDDVTVWIYENVPAINAKSCSNFGDVNSDSKDTTVVIKFSSEDKVINFSYHKSVF
jgi:hypothetical protein